MAVQATLLEIPFDPRTLYDSQDRHYLLWLGSVIDRVATERRRQNERAQKGR